MQDAENASVAVGTFQSRGSQLAVNGEGKSDLEIR